MYIVLPKLLLAVMPQSCKRSFAIFFITVCGTLAVNNTIKICGGPWLLDTIDLRWILLLSLVVAAAFYFTENIPGLYDHQSLANALGIAVGWVCVFVLIEAGFLALGCILDGNVG